MKISDLSPGQKLYSVERQGLGNTTMRTTAVYLVRILSVEEGRFRYSWNGNSPRTATRIPANWRKNKPYIVRGLMTARLATREERKTLKFVEYGTRMEVKS